MTSSSSHAIVWKLLSIRLSAVSELLLCLVSTDTANAVASRVPGQQSTGGDLAGILEQPQQCKLST